MTVIVGPHISRKSPPTWRMPTVRWSSRCAPMPPARRFARPWNCCSTSRWARVTRGQRTRKGQTARAVPGTAGRLEEGLRASRARARHRFHGRGSRALAWRYAEPIQPRRVDGSSCAPCATTCTRAIPTRPCCGRNPIPAAATTRAASPTRHRGGGHKRHYRVVDFRRNKDGVPGRVERIEYDPNRSAYLALVLYRDGERRYILAPRRCQVGDPIQSGSDAPIKPGNALPLKNIPVGTQVHCVGNEGRKGRPDRPQRRRFGADHCPRKAATLP